MLKARFKDNIGQLLQPAVSNHFFRPTLHAILVRHETMIGKSKNNSTFVRRVHQQEIDRQSQDFEDGFNLFHQDLLAVSLLQRPHEGLVLFVGLSLLLVPFLTNAVVGQPFSILARANSTARCCA